MLCITVGYLSTRFTLRSEQNRNCITLKTITVSRDIAYIYIYLQFLVTKQGILTINGCTVW